MSSITNTHDVVVKNVLSGLYLSVSNSDISDGEATSVVGLSEKFAGRDDIVWRMNEIPSVGRVIRLVHKKSGGALTRDDNPIDTVDSIPSYNAIAKKGNESYFFSKHYVGGTSLLSLDLSVDRPQCLAFRQIGTITALWAPVDVSGEVSEDVQWIIQDA